MDEGELDLGVELLDVGTLGLLIGESLDVDDLDTLSATTVAGGHVVVHLGNSANTADVAELLVQVVSTAATVVSDPNGVVLDGGDIKLRDLQKENKKKKRKQSGTETKSKVRDCFSLPFFFFLFFC